jgi:hypothetical protein
MGVIVIGAMKWIIGCRDGNARFGLQVDQVANPMPALEMIDLTT